MALRLLAGLAVIVAFVGFALFSLTVIAYVFAVVLVLVLALGAATARTSVSYLRKNGPNPASRLYRTEGCACADLKDRERLGLGWDVLGGGLEELGYETLRERTPWLELARCTRCGQHWYVATDTVEDDVYMQRLTGAETRDILEHALWPTSFDRLKHVGLDRFGGPE